jgi:hypothetical protein
MLPRIDKMSNIRPVFRPFAGRGPSETNGIAKRLALLRNRLQRYGRSQRQQLSQNDPDSPTIKAQAIV